MYTYLLILQACCGWRLGCVGWDRVWVLGSAAGGGRGFPVMLLPYAAFEIKPAGSWMDPAWSGWILDGDDQ